MKRALVATAMLSTSSILTLVVGLVTAKLWSQLVGARGYGHAGLIQSSIALAAIVADVGLATSIVREAARPAANEDRSEVLDVWATASWLLLPWLLALAGAIVWQRARVAQLVFDDVRFARDIGWAAVALVFTVTANVRTALLNAHHRVKTLATTNVVTSIIGAAVGLLFVLPRGVTGIAPGVAAGAAARWVGVSIALWRATGLVVPAGRFVRARAEELVRQGLPLTASLLVGPGTATLLPVIILRVLDKAAVGHYGAANTIAITIIGLLINAMAQDFHPRITLVKHDSDGMRALVREQHRMLMLLGVPLLLAVKWGAGWAVPLVFTREFVPVSGILDWHVIGELLRFSAMSYSYVLLVNEGGMTFFLPAIASGATLILAAIGALHWWGIAGVGVAFTMSQAAFWCVVVLFVRRRQGWALDAEQWRMLGIGLVALTMGNFIPKAWPNVRFAVDFVVLAAFAVRNGAVLLRALRSS